MSETKYSPEPWRALLNGSGPHSIATSASVVVSFCNGIAKAEDARRIVACVNACAGIPTEALEAHTLTGAVRALAVLVDDGEPASCRRLAISEGRYHLRALGRLP